MKSNNRIISIIEKQLLNTVSSLYKESQFLNLENRFHVKFGYNRKHGDVTTNIAMVLSAQLKRNPLEIAEQIINHIKRKITSDSNAATNNAINSKSPTHLNKPDTDDYCTQGIFDTISAAAPGFINITLSNKIWIECLQTIIEQDDDYRVKNALNFGNQHKVNIEYVSANPTGYLHIGNARGAVYGDVLANLMEYCDFSVTKEYYINDFGNQIDTLVKSVFAKYKQKNGIQATIEDDFYKGDYIDDFADDLYKRYGAALFDKIDSERGDIISSYCISTIMTEIKNDLIAIGVKHDTFISEKNDIRTNFLSQTLEDLEKMGLSYTGYLEKPKAEIGNKAEKQVIDTTETVSDNTHNRNKLSLLKSKLSLFKSKDYGDDEDRVLLKNDGTPTYFALDVAYHKYKIDRGFDNIILVLGVDHIGYAARIRAIVKALGGDKVNFHVPFVNMVHLLDENNVSITMSKRSGNFIRLKTLNDEIGKDVLRFYMINRKNDTIIDLNIKNAKEQSQNNPIFYIQYAHTRACSIINKAKEIGIISKEDIDIRKEGDKVYYHHNKSKSTDKKQATTQLDYEMTHLYETTQLSDTQIALSSTEADIIKKILELPNIIEECFKSLEMHILTYYLYELATLFHTLWNAGINDDRMRFLLPNDINLSKTRIDMVYMVARTIGRVFKIIGITPLTEM